MKAILDRPQIFIAHCCVDYLLQSNEFFALQIMLPRLSYFALSTDKVKKYLSRFVSEDTVDQMWFSFEGNPVRLHLPIGVIYDQLRAEGGNEEALGPPWKLTVHFGNFPEAQILKCLTKEAIESQFMSAVKEADQLNKNSVNIFLKKGLSEEIKIIHWTV